MTPEEIWIFVLNNAIKGGVPYNSAVEMADAAVKDFAERFRK